MSENLKPFNELTAEEQRKIASKGGKASVAARKKRKALREYAETIMDLPLEGANRERVKALGVDPEDLTNGMAMVVATYNQAMKGNPKCINIMREMLGERVVEHKVTASIDASAAELDELLKEAGASETNPY